MASLYFNAIFVYKEFSVKQLRWPWFIWGFLLIAQVVFYVLNFPRLLPVFVDAPNAFSLLVFIDVVGISSWVIAWFVYRSTDVPASSKKNFVVGVFALLSLSSFVVQFCR
jgi:hypothetical protein